MRVIAWLVGVALAASAVAVVWPYSDRHRIYGFPFPAAIFERTEVGWLDFVGPLTLPALVGDFVVMLLFPQIGVTLYGKSKARKLEIQSPAEEG